MSWLYPVRLRSPLRRRPDAATWHVARDISQRAEPDVRPLGCTVSAFIAKRTPPVHPVDRRCAPSEFNATCPLRWQAAPGPSCRRCPFQSIVKQCARAVRRTVLIIPYTRSFPCTPILHRSRMSGCEEIAPAANICSSKCYIHYVPGPTCRGSAPLCMPPLAIKGEACNVTTQAL